MGFGGKAATCLGGEKLRGNAKRIVRKGGCEVCDLMREI